MKLAKKNSLYDSSFVRWLLIFLEEVVLNSISPALLRNQFRMHDNNLTIIGNEENNSFNTLITSLVHAILLN